MLQTLPAERFSLRTHREIGNVKAYALVAAKRGPKLHPSSKAADESLDASLTFREGRVAARNMSMPSLANRISGPVFKLGPPVRT